MHFAIQGDGLHGQWAGAQNGAAGGFVNPAGFHADIPVFDDIDPADAMFATYPVQLGQHVGRRGQRLAVQRYRVSGGKGDFDGLRGVRGCLGRPSW
jgi:hypothetical protein